MNSNEIPYGVAALSSVQARHRRIDTAGTCRALSRPAPFGK